MIEIQKKSEFDFLLLFLCVALWVVGLFLIYSATHIHESGPLANSTRNQVIWVVMGFITILIIASLPTHIFFSLSYVAYGLSILLLLYGFFTGVITKGAVDYYRRHSASTRRIRKDRPCPGPRTLSVDEDALPSKDDLIYCSGHFYFDSLCAHSEAA
jgi:hypothetical protein